MNQGNEIGVYDFYKTQGKSKTIRITSVSQRKIKRCPINCLQVESISTEETAQLFPTLNKDRTRTNLFISRSRDIEFARYTEVFDMKIFKCVRTP